MTDNVDIRFPKGLLFWAGHRDGGVRKPFVDNSGRPTGGVIRTHLLDKIDNWIDAIVQQDGSAHRGLLMIGGPGNGKTEAVEYFIEKFDHKLRAMDALRNKCKTELTPSPGSLASRKITINLSDIPFAEKISYKRLEIVHDATVGDSEMPGSSPERLLISDLKNVNKDDELLYISCINRGILSQTLDWVTSSTEDKYIKEMLENILSAVTLSPEQPSCWPLHGYSHVAVWPMDMESLVDQSAYEGGITPAYHIFKRALDRSLWISSEDCPAKKLCPFHTNLELLSDETLLGNLIKILRHYEISSGKRLTFRELFSLVPQLLVGHENDFRLRGKDVDPCDWAAGQVKIIQTSNDAYERTRARFFLFSKIYNHALFPRWPNLRAVRDHCKQVLKSDPSDDANANDVFRLLGWLRKDESTSIHKLIREQIGVLLDPVEVSGSVILAGDGHSADNLEEMFSYSVEQGYNATREWLSEIERDFMDWVIHVERRIEEDSSKGNKNLVERYDEVHKNIRLFACRLVKRSLAVRKGITKENKYLERYAKTIEDEFELKNVRKQFNELIHENSRFPVSLSTTFGQPVPHHHATLRAPMVKVTYMLPPKSGQHARSSLSYLKIKNHAMPLTYPLFKALAELKEGLMEASIPTDILAMIERMRARMAGEIVRDIDSLDDATLSVGDTNLSLTIQDGKITAVEQK